MPVKPETRFYSKVNAKLHPDVHRQKITSIYGNGTPDFWYSGTKADGWVEYKWVSSLSRNGVDPLKLLSPLQALWINRRCSEGRLVLVVIGSSEGCAILESGAWNVRVEKQTFSHSISAVSAILTGKFHDPSAVSESSGSGNESDVQNSDDNTSNSRSRVRSV